MDKPEIKNCPICFQFIVEPVSLPCNHVFCINCIEEAALRKKKCPMCRELMPMSFMPKIDKKIQRQQKKEYPKEFDESEKELQKIKVLEKDLDRIVIKYGNTHEAIDQANNKHKWKFFIETFKSKHRFGDLVDKINIKLHPTFGTTDVSLKSPYTFSARGWGIFEIPIKIKWKKWTKLEDMELSHLLSFENDENASYYSIKVPKIERRKSWVI